MRVKLPARLRPKVEPVTDRWGEAWWCRRVDEVLDRVDYDEEYDPAHKALLCWAGVSLPEWSAGASFCALYPMAEILDGTAADDLSRRILRLAVAVVRLERRREERGLSGLLVL